MTTSTQTVSICGKTYQSREAFSQNSCNGCAGYKFCYAFDLCMKLPNCMADEKGISIIWVEVE